MTPASSTIRVDLQLIADMIEPRSRVLDVGCGDGTLLDYLVQFKQVDGRGIELSSDGVNACVSAGLSVIQGDADTDLFDYPDRAFDYVVLSQTLQAMRAPRTTLQQLLRIGGHAIVSMPNFAHWRLRWALLTEGRMPVSDALPHAWYDSPEYPPLHHPRLRRVVPRDGCAHRAWSVPRPARHPAPPRLRSHPRQPAR